MVSRSSNGTDSARDARAVPATTAEDKFRLSINLGPDVADALKGYSHRKGVSVTEAVRRAISMLTYVDGVQARGASINISENGVLKEVQFLA